jgi:hypothetical protein
MKHYESYVAASKAQHRRRMGWGLLAFSLVAGVGLAVTLGLRTLA